MLDDLVNDLNLIVGLNAEFVAELSKLLVVELHAIIRNDLLRYVVLIYYCLLYKVLEFFAGDRGK